MFIVPVPSNVLEILPPVKFNIPLMLLAELFMLEALVFKTPPALTVVVAREMVPVLLTTALS